jgi:GT2 family glycosyltransferase
MRMSDEKIPLVSVVVLNCNGKVLLERCLTSIFNSDCKSLEIILVDNGSVDGSIEFVREEFGNDPKLKIILNESNLGVAEGHNVGIRHSRGRYIAFLDNDTQISSKWFNELVKALELDPTIGAVQSKIMLMDKQNTFDSTGGFIDYYGVSCERGNRIQDIGQYENITEIFHSKCSAMIVRRDVLDEVGWFDNRYFTHYDDTDLCWRIWLRGYRVIYVPTTFAYHNVSFTASELKLDETYYLAKNCITTLIKNYERKNMFKYLAGFLFLELTRFMYYFFRRDRKSTSLVKAIVWNMVHLRSTWRIRIKIQYTLRRVSDDQIMKGVMIKPCPFPLRLLYRIVRCK